MGDSKYGFLKEAPTLATMRSEVDWFVALSDVASADGCEHDLRLLASF